MMQEQKTATLMTIFSDVLANLAFMFSDESDTDTQAGDLWLETTIGYYEVGDGGISGKLYLLCPREFSILLAANLLGVNPEDDDAGQAAEDAVKEFMNIVCGQLVTALHGTEDVFNLTIPKLKELPETPDFTDTDNPEIAVLSVEGHRVQLSYIPGDNDD